MIERWLPMLAVSSPPFDSPEHVFEVKWDGVRALAAVEPSGWRIWGRERSDYTQRYPELESLRSLPAGTVLDGELIVLESGRAAFARLMRRHQLVNGRKIQAASRFCPVTYVVFDLLSAGGQSLLARPLSERRQRLQELVARQPPCRLAFSDIAAIWFFSTRTGIVVAISSKEDQLEKALWNEIELLLRSATWNGRPVDFGFACKHLEIRHRLDNGRSLPKSYMIGRCVSQDENLAGVHLATLDDGTPTVLFICEEASGIDDKLWPVIRTSAHRMLVIGNPIRTSGEFYQICAAGQHAHHAQPGKLYRDVITISGEDSPNVKLGMACAKEGLPQPDRPPMPGVLSYETFLELQKTLPPWSIRPRLYGLPNDDTTTKLFPASCLDLAQELYQRLKEHEAELKKRRRRYRWGGPLALGVDCAMGGGDLSSWAIYSKYGVVHVEVIDTPNTRRIKGHTLRLMKTWRIAPEWVCFDRAIGKGIADEMREKGMDVDDIGFGKKAFDDGKYVNRRVELYGELARGMRRMVDDDGKPTAKIKRLLDTPVRKWDKRWTCVALPPDALLREELFILPQCEDGEGRLWLPRKAPRGNGRGANDDTIKGMLGRSPDRADAAVLSKSAFDRGQEYRDLSTIDGPLVY